MDSDDVGEDRWLFLNDWPKRRFLVAVISFLVLLVCFSALRLIAGDIPALNYLGYVFVPFLIIIPGAAALRMLKVHGLDMARSGVYSVALGVFFLMILGFGLNFFHYVDLVNEPLSFEFLSVAFPLTLMIFVVFSLKRDADYVAPNVHHSLDLTTLVILTFSISLPIIAICAAKMIGFEGDRTAMYYVLTLACFTPLIILSHRTRHYELLILSLSLTILFQRAFMTNYLIGYDIFSEYSASSITTANGWWNVAESDILYGGGANTALSIVTLGPMLSNLTSIETIELLKIIYPFIFSFVPLMLYKAIQGQLGSKAALLGAIVFIGYHGFYNLMTQLAKQEIAELFLVAIVLVITDKALKRFDKRLLIGIFLIGVVVSHYSVAYMVMAILLALFALQLLAWVVRSFREWLAANGRPSLLKWIKNTVLSYFRAQLRQHIVTFEIVILIIILFYAWYGWAANGLMLNAISTGQSYIDPTATSDSASSLTLSQMDAIEFLFIDYSSLLHNTEKYMLLATQIITIFGVLFMWIKGRAVKGKMDDEFLFLGMIGAVILFAAYVVPNLSLSFYHGRFFHFTQIFLCGFFAAGIYAVFSMIRNIVSNMGLGKGRRRVDVKKVTLWAATGMVVLFLCFNTGVIYIMAGESSFNISLDESMSGSVYSDSDVVTAKWLGNETHLGTTHPMADYHRFPVLSGQQMYIWNLKYQFTANDTDSFIYLSGWNNEYGYVYPLNTVNGATLSYTPQQAVLQQVEEYDVPYSSSGQSTIIYIPAGDPVTNPPGPSIYTYEDSPMIVVPVVIIALTSLTIAAWASGLYVAHKNKD